MSEQPVSLGVVGIGGFGKEVLRCVRRLEKRQPSLAKLTAVCEPMQELHAAALDELRSQGVTVVSDLDQMLKLPVQALWMPVPIPLHRDYSCRAVEAGKWVMCEKPAAGVIQDVDAMIATRDRVGGKLLIAYQDIYESATPTIKGELLSGAIGRIERSSTVVCWPRGSDYFGRNNWAGHARKGDTWVLDSPCMNAMAHYVNLPLFLMGAAGETSVTPVRVTAELYRARAIETADTCAIRVDTAEGSKALFLMTHACAENTAPQMTFWGTKGRCIVTPTEARFEPSSGRNFTISRFIDHSQTMEAALLRWRGIEPQRLVATLELARTQVLAVNAAFDAAAVHQLPDDVVRVQQKGDVLQPVLERVVETLSDCGERGVLPSEAGASWAQAPGTLDLKNYSHFTGQYFR